MKTTKLSSKGQVVLPKEVRERQKWQPGTTLIVEETSQGVLLRPQKPFPPTRFEDVFGCLQYTGKPKTLEEMDAAIPNEVRRRRALGRY
jgi:AbrB family looped-hinge helix DNA binding protein